MLTEVKENYQPGLQKQRHKKFNLIYLMMVLSSSIVVGALNLIIDPYDVMNSPTISHINQNKVKKGANDRLFKAVDITRIKPDAILLGSSRTRQGLNPAHPLLAKYSRPYNLGLNGVNPYEELRYLEHAIANNKDLKLVVIGIDFFMFNDRTHNQAAFSEERLGKTSLTIKDFLSTTLSLDALTASIETIEASQQTSKASRKAENGFMPYQDINSSQDATLWRFRSSLSGYFDSHKKYDLSEKYLLDFRRIVELCQQRGITLKVFISPAHTTDLVAVDITGHWKTLEQWKREVVQIVPVWDFSGVNSVTTEQIGANMKNYSDYSHYREKIGNLILDRLLSEQNNSAQDNSIPSDFGALITPANIESHLSKTRSDFEQWQKSHPDEVELVKAVKEEHDREHP